MPCPDGDRGAGHPAGTRLSIPGSPWAGVTAVPDAPLPRDPPPLLCPGPQQAWSALPQDTPLCTPAPSPPSLPRMFYPRTPRLCWKPMPQDPPNMARTHTPGPLCHPRTPPGHPNPRASLPAPILHPVCPQGSAVLPRTPLPSPGPICSYNHPKVLQHGGSPPGRGARQPQGQWGPTMGQEVVPVWVPALPTTRPCASVLPAPTATPSAGAEPSSSPGGRVRGAGSGHPSPCGPVLCGATCGKKGVAEAGSILVSHKLSRGRDTPSGPAGGWCACAGMASRFG